MKKRYMMLILAIILLLAACSTRDDTEATAKQKELTISAAASLTDVMDELKEIYETENDVELTFNFAGSGKLAQQIQQGAPVDVFISANENWLDILLEEELIDADSTTDVTGNKLVLIASANTSIEYDSFSNIDTNDLSNIAVGKPESVPAGEYTKKALEAIGKWEEIKSQLVYAKDVRQVLTYVETENAEIGFVYESDALSSDKVKILAEADSKQHDPIIYPGGVTTETKEKEAAEGFLAFMASDKAQNVLETYGFTK